WGSENMDDFKGMSKNLPLMAVILTVIMVSLTGLPPTAGFIAKLQVFLAGLDVYQTGAEPLIMVLLIAILINTVVSLFYYLRVPSVMIFKNPVIKNMPRFHGLVPVLLVIMSIPVLWLGILSFDALINFLSDIVPI
ncbi:MAG: proton-conducting transporter membrane subunit, partial [Bacteroidota bacterium]